MGRGLDMQDFPEDLIAEFTLKIWTIKAKWRIKHWGTENFSQSRGDSRSNWKVKS